LVRDSGSEQGIGQDEELSSNGDESDSGSFATCLERGVEAFHGGAVADGGDGGLVECHADFGTTAADMSDAAGGSAVVGEGSEADEGSDGSARPLSEFGQVHQEDAGDLPADADDGLEDFVFGFESFGVGDDAVHALFKIIDLALEEGDVLVDVLDDFGRCALSGVAMVFLGGEHADELAATVAKFAKFQDFLGRQRPHHRGDDLAEMSENAGIDGVGFGELSGPLGEVPDLPGVDHHGGQVGCEQSADRGLLIRAGRLKDDPLGRQGSKPGDELFDARGCVVEALWETAGSRMGVEKIPADIDADQDSVHERTSLNHKNEPEDRRRSCSSW